ncbi:HlyD family efflux transporter periplasmic adaptor subunit [Bradyrhizobium sp. 83012]|uniref:HlyD family efflux transporter periplasmic adaptor subunit n=1 Tax=Bradyrhizobium aeschynomenes TaxID=2734909 RepID=A0ABX2CDX3_9BRAD|nr:HlyD family efflux transporter periplasmic adaptor subunit [Bradyrhizobium aeschynomenes]NPU65472.1 HlyD family efflux transporter periplasmic adaptor subunit [Bradyrhizobium aeschynomenes]
MDPQDTRLADDERPVQQVRAEAAALVPAPALPVAVAHELPPKRRMWPLVVLLVLLAGAAGGGGYVWWQRLHPPLPLGISVSNGRIEADEIDIATKYAGRVAELRADIGDLVEAGQIVARMDSKELQQSLSKATAQAEQAQHVIDQARASLAQLRAQKTLAEQEMDRTRSLLQNGWTTRELADQRQQALDAAIAGVAGAQARISEAERGLEAARHDVALYTVQIADNSLIAPKAGRIQYRLANVGEVLGAGGKVFTMLDIGYVYIDVFLPTEEVGKIKVGSDARIVLDAYPDRPIPAKVAFVASQAQFTPKTVETRSERDKLMFRIRVRVDPDRLAAHADAVRSGLPGVAYLRWNPDVAWPARLQAAP